jgi:hypothetical protein
MYCGLSPMHLFFLLEMIMPSCLITRTIYKSLGTSIAQEQQCTFGELTYQSVQNYHMLRSNFVFVELCTLPSENMALSLPAWEHFSF